MRAPRAVVSPWVTMANGHRPSESVVYHAGGDRGRNPPAADFGLGCDLLRWYVSRSTDLVPAISTLGRGMARETRHALPWARLGLPLRGDVTAMCHADSIATCQTISTAPYLTASTPLRHDTIGRPTNATRSGFTVIELLAASTLAAVMMVLVMGVIGSMSARHRALRATPSHAWQDQLRDQIRWDLSNSEYLTTHANGASLRGFAGSDWSTGVATHRPTEIFYFVKRIDGRSWLVRRETHLDELTNRNSREELVCADVDSFTIQVPSSFANNAVFAQKLPDYAVVRLVNHGGEVIVDEEMRWR